MLAPMAGVSTPKLVAAASNNGIIGMHGVGLLSVTDTIRDIRAIMSHTDAAFGINIFVHDQKIIPVNEFTHKRVERARERLRPFYARFNVEPPTLDEVISHTIVQQSLGTDMQDKIEIALEEKIPYLSFTFGCLDKEIISKLRKNGTTVIGTATSVSEALVLEQAGVDAVVAQGSEAGGHRGSFLDGSSLVSTMTLVPKIVDSVNIPVIAAGGIMDGRGVCSALCLGAEGV